MRLHRSDTRSGEASVLQPQGEEELQGGRSRPSGASLPSGVERSLAGGATCPTSSFPASSRGWTPTDAVLSLSGHQVQC